MGHLLRAWLTWGWWEVVRKCFERRGDQTHGRRGRAWGESIQQWRAYAHKTGCARFALFTGGHQKAYNGASARSWILVFCKKGNSGICSEDDFLSSFSFWHWLGHTGRPPLTLRHLVVWPKRCFFPLGKERRGPNIS
ncbi:uncharacterized protein LY79DRAFT_107805 [Colletotrichum navitas]|uniref:Uncharacterized protein n=1 Tax=Colletotrichum navitas TaxID=681940 RepID=A0AAD8Q4C7_9PEZI|nr:uncharacterized protein LY79DRAFT_107805 [Colletotrichum navitas]KAK1595243.1 hypothetical protein LY79DRAFT_107805 [Colletotrichum navitas]